MIKQVNVETILPLRSLVLRENKGVEFAKFEGDNDEHTIHLAIIEDNQVLSIASFMKCNYSNYEGLGFQLRGMATHPDYVGKGYASALINYALSSTVIANANYIWFNARKSAVPFYEKLNFKIISKEFEIDNIGPHFVMYNVINN
ncbi:GNAT family N-acetyltransferase [Pedobacter flavus]|uniref:GNAT family N-acetyltransferase n=1 Tax=Pedobacter flavus TaxID=3113906 RepID=A0ABU7GXZ0_9SPHI|nr:GNAT family N-acetyltransferase [Pedobacter sp. VNH31]MEE1883899.1 GNAT family N-acetyltransferase [Pedobacter sp. VNH31]